MSIDVLDRIYYELSHSKFRSDCIELVWHSGEPLTLHIDYYKEAFDLSERYCKLDNIKFTHTIQTNATLINEQWINLFQKYGIKVGVSVDGPSIVHDQKRITKSGQGSHYEVMQGVKLLQENEIPFSTIMVLTYGALDFPEEIFTFFMENNIKNIGINIDEIEGSNQFSSYEIEDSIQKYRDFIRRFIKLVDDSKGALNVREFRSIVRQLLFAKNFEKANNMTNTPLGLLTFDSDGNYSAFCPELVGASSKKYNNFIMGNVLVNSIDEIPFNSTFNLINKEVKSGKDKCKNSCHYWGFCGGGAPSNKYFEHGRFDVTTTLACRIHKGVLVDTIIEYLENKL